MLDNFFRLCQGASPYPAVVFNSKGIWYAKANCNRGKGRSVFRLGLRRRSRGFYGSSRRGTRGRRSLLLLFGPDRLCDPRLPWEPMHTG